MLAIDTSPVTRFLSVRQKTEEICYPLTAEDHVVQPVEDVSPPKWHLGHTTWFYEAFILQEFSQHYKPFNDRYAFIFNSYYESKGARIIRTNRGNLTRPSVKEVLEYRSYVDEHMSEFLTDNFNDDIAEILELGLNHEQQHQELLMYDIKYILGNNPLFPEYRPYEKFPTPQSIEKSWLSIEEGIYSIGHDSDDFSFDNEHGRHQVYLHTAKIQNTLITNREYLEFIEDGGYKNFRHWLSDGWEWVKNNDITAPLYWYEIDGSIHIYSLNGGLQLLNPDAPVSHISFYEANAFVKWRDSRLPTEFEWEVACKLYGDKDKGNLLSSHCLEPLARDKDNNQFFGDVWEWTNSAYLPYPFYTAPPGALGEYNGKFMIDQMVLRGGSCVTPEDHIRSTYRNFFQPQHRWMFSGFRLANYI